MSERHFALVDFTHMSRARCLRLYEAGHTYTLPRAIAHAATKRRWLKMALLVLMNCEIEQLCRPSGLKCSAITNASAFSGTTRLSNIANKAVCNQLRG